MNEQGGELSRSKELDKVDPFVLYEGEPRQVTHATKIEGKYVEVAKEIRHVPAVPYVTVERRSGYDKTFQVKFGLGVGDGQNSFSSVRFPFNPDYPEGPTESGALHSVIPEDKQTVESIDPIFWFQVVTLMNMLPTNLFRATKINIGKSFEEVPEVVTEINKGVKPGVEAYHPHKDWHSLLGEIGNGNEKAVVKKIKEAVPDSAHLDAIIKLLKEKGIEIDTKGMERVRNRLTRSEVVDSVLPAKPMDHVKKVWGRFIKRKSGGEIRPTNAGQGAARPTSEGNK